MSDAVKFEVEQELGRGGTSVVYLARMQRGDETEPVALKRLRIPPASDEAVLRQFRREAHTCALLRHPNIVTLKAHGVDAEGPYLALELIVGCTASDLVKSFQARSQRMPLEIALCILSDVAAGLAYAHSVEHAAGTGLIHRDISPDNILIGHDGAAKLADFGIAQLDGGTHQSTTGTIKGKFGFLAPEMYDGHPADIPTDLFAFGATAYELLVGTRAFPGRTDAERMKSVLSADPPPIATARSDVPVQVTAFIHRCLSRDRAQRPGGAGELVSLIARRLPDETARRVAVASHVREMPPRAPVEFGSTGSHLGATATFGRFPRPRRALAWAALAAGMVAAGAATHQLTRGEQPSPPSVAARMAASVAPSAPGQAQQSSPGVRPPADVHPAAPSTPPAGGPSAYPVPPKRVRKRAQQPRGSANAARLGTLEIRVKPWGQVFVDGVLRGATPLDPLELPPGLHSVIVVNPALGARRSLKAHVVAGERRELRVDLEQPADPGPQ